MSDDGKVTAHGPKRVWVADLDAPREEQEAVAGMLALRDAVLQVDANWAAQYSERFAAELLDQLDRAGYRVVPK